MMSSKGDSMLRRVFVILVVLVSLGTISDKVTAGNNVVGPTPLDIMKELDLYRKKDLKNAARLLRSAAVEWGVDSAEIPEWSYIDYKESDNKVHIRFPVVEKEYPLDWEEIIQFSRDERVTLAFVASRGLSIDEIAFLLENNVNFLDNLITFSRRNAFMVNVSEGSYQTLREQTYFELACLYQPEDKVESYCLNKQEGRYTVKYYGDFDEEYKRDLDECSVRIKSVVEQFNGIVVVGDLASIEKVTNLWWVELIACDPGASFGNDENASELKKNTDNPIDLPLSESSRLLLGGDVVGSGSGVVVGVLEVYNVFPGGPSIGRDAEDPAGGPPSDGPGGHP